MFSDKYDELGSISNPSWGLYSKLSNNVVDVRSSLYKKMKQVSPVFADEAFQILSRKLEHAKTPPLGELYPWIIQDVARLDRQSVHDIAISWLAIYIYMIFLDDHIDTAISLTPETFIAGSLLAKTGLLGLYKIIIGTDYEQSFDDAISSAAVGQLLGTIINKQGRPSEIEKFSEMKNYLLMACAYALASSNKSQSEFIIQFTESFMLALQYLDDLADWEEDINQNSTTLLLTLAYNSSQFDDPSHLESRREKILEQLIVSGALSTILLKVQSQLNQSLSILTTHDPFTDKSVSWVFFTQLLSEVDILLSLLKPLEANWTKLPKDRRQAMINEVDQGILNVQTFS